MVDNLFILVKIHHVIMINKLHGSAATAQYKIPVMFL